MKHKSPSRLTGSLVTLAIATILGQGNIALAQPHSDAKHFDISDQLLVTALNEFARQSDRQILFSTEAVSVKRTKGVKGELEPEAALRQLLQGTGLTFRLTSDNTILVEDARSGRAAAGSEAHIRLAEANASAAGAEGADSRNDRDTPDQTAQGSAQLQQIGALEEVLVTAQKRSERLQDVPVSVTAISADLLTSGNELRLDDYYSKVPALSLTTGQPFGGSTVSIRGIITGINQSPTVGVVVDDVPYTSSNVRGFGHLVAEIDPSDLQSVEVLRGPQGTLYGASSIGGLLKYVTVDPSMDRFSGNVQGGLSTVRNGDEAGYSARGAVNIPVSDTFAVRASAFTRRAPGYIDDPVRGAKGVNTEEASGGRMTALWRPSDNLSLKLSALLQDSDGDGNAHVDLLPGFGDLEQSTPPDSEGYSKKLQVYSASLSASFGQVTFDSISAYTSNKNAFMWDFSKRFGALANRTFPGTTGSTSVQEVETDKFTQELRFSVPLGERVEWRFGAFYNHEDTSHNEQKVYATNYTTGARVGELAYLVVEDTFKEYAAFSDVTFTVTDRFDLQLGGRYSKNEEELLQVNSGVLFGGSFPEPLVTSEDSSFTYLVTPRFKLARDFMVYARLASGYRPGGPNVGTSLSTVVPRSYGPDKTRSYEVGLKADWLDRRVTLDASAFYIDWKDIQLTLREVLTYIGNAAEAKSQGVELTIDVRPTSGLTLSAWGTWNEAELTEDFPLTTVGAVGRKGDRLPFGSRLSGNLSLTQEFPVGSVATGFVGGAVSYVGERYSVFTTSPVRARFPSYTKFDVRAGLAFDTWKANLFANNVGDERGILSDAFYPNAVTYIQPRTIGVSLSKSF